MSLNKRNVAKEQGGGAGRRRSSGPGWRRGADYNFKRDERTGQKRLSWAPHSLRGKGFCRVTVDEDEGRQPSLWKLLFSLFSSAWWRGWPGCEDVRRPAPTTTTTNLHLKRGCWLVKGRLGIAQKINV